MNDLVVKFLKNKGYSGITTDYYSYVEFWERLWKNNADYLTYYDDYKQKHTLYNLGMAKRVCEDWSSIISSEQDEIVSNKRQNKKYIESLVKDLKLKTELQDCSEIASWSGTCGAIIRLDNVLVVNGVMQASEKTTKQLIKVDAKNIIPLKSINGKIVNVAFVSTDVINDKKVIYVELHELEDDGYKISNTYLDIKTGKVVENDGVLSEFKTGSNVPLFSLLTPPRLNTIENNNGLGLSVYANAISQIEATDIVYNNFVMDFYLGGKKVFYNKKIVPTKTITHEKNDGSIEQIDIPIYPDNVTKQQWKVIGDGMENINDEPMYKEYNPDLRVNDNKAGVQFALDMLSFKCGFGTKYYQFNGSSVVTATQYVGDRQDLVENAKKYRDNLQEFINGIVKAGLLLGRVIFKQNVTEECEIEIANVDGFLQDTESLKKQWREELAMGLRTKVEYRMKFYGEDEETAKAMLNDDLQEVDLGA